jgi:hypothetical protein|tara:strand:+ start:506 stop:778 length:273 start_codon:yes stop_codon:yes gene_type:complete
MSNSYSDFKWCIENDFQVYIKPIVNGGECCIAIRKGGISTDGKPSKYNKEKGLTLYSTETLGTLVYKNQKKASEKLPEVYKYLRKCYGNV